MFFEKKSPGTWTYLWFLFTAAARCMLSWNLPIVDCDETYNYWEPLHFVLYGSGMQTWEYSPRYALRSWLYILLHAGLAYPTYALGLPKPLVFRSVRCLLGIFVTLSEYYFYKGVRHRFGFSIAALSLLFMSLSPGINAASVSFLPSSFVMLSNLLVFGAWMRYGTSNPKNWQIACAFSIVGCFVGWPFGGLCLVPIALHTLHVYGWKQPFVFCSVLSLFTFTMLFVTDWMWYCVPVSSFLRILSYNVFSQDGGGATLYGTEPWTFFVKNFAMNFSVVFPLSLILPLRWLLQMMSFLYNKARNKKVKKHVPSLSTPLLFCLPYYIFFGFWLFVPHKEERFMFPVYPLICLSAAIAFQNIYSVWQRRGFHYHVAAHRILIVFYAVLSVARIVLLCVEHRGAVQLHENLFRSIPSVEKHYKRCGTSCSGRSVTVCYGKEWYRYPSSFFLPKPDVNHTYSIAYVPSEFHGQLPAPFMNSCTDGTKFNHLNQRIGNLYTSPASCDFVIDSLETGRESDFSSDQWVKLYTASILDPPRSPFWSRSFYIPYLSPQVNNYISLDLLIHKKYCSTHTFPV